MGSSISFLLVWIIANLSILNESINQVTKENSDSQIEEPPSQAQRRSYHTSSTKENYYLRVTVNNQIYIFDDQSDPPTLTNSESVEGPIGIRYPGTIEIVAKGQPPLAIYIQSVPNFLVKPDTIALTKGRFVINQSEVYSRSNGHGGAGRLMIHKIDTKAVEGSFYMVLDSKTSEISRIKGQFRAKYLL